MRGRKAFALGSGNSVLWAYFRSGSQQGQVEEGIWLVSFMNCDLGYVDLEEKTLQPLDNPFGPKV
jgi:hypothetical protein